MKENRLFNCRNFLRYCYSEILYPDLLNANEFSMQFSNLRFVYARMHLTRSFENPRPLMIMKLFPSWYIKVANVISEDIMSSLHFHHGCALHTSGVRCSKNFKDAFWLLQSCRVVEWTSVAWRNYFTYAQNPFVLPLDDIYFWSHELLLHEI